MSYFWNIRTIEIGNKKFNISYDSGCGDLYVRRTAVDRLIKLNRARQVVKGPLILAGVGDVKSVRGETTMSRLCLTLVTGEFTMYPLDKVASDFHTKEVKIKMLSRKLPKPPKEVGRGGGGGGGGVVGIQYLQYHPNEIATLETGLTLYCSAFKNPDSSNGVIAGPHPEFTKVNRSVNIAGKMIYINIVLAYDRWMGCKNEIPLLLEKREIYKNAFGFSQIMKVMKKLEL